MQNDLEVEFAIYKKEALEIVKNREEIIESLKLEILELKSQIETLKQQLQRQERIHNHY